MAVSARDVARLAGVSVSTVSRALTRPHQVAPETRDRVLRTAAGLGYRPNPAARSLITGRTGNIGLVVPDLGNPFFASVTKAVQGHARDGGYAVFVADTDEDPVEESLIARNLAKQVDGIVLCAPRGPDAEIEAIARECTVVLVNRRLGDLPFVTMDDADCVRQAVVHLRALGHRSLAFVGGPESSWTNAERLAAFRAAGHAHADMEMLELGPVHPVIAGGVAAADPVIASGATGVIAYNDLVALGLLERFRQRGVRVPEDISVVGIDDLPVSSMVSPALTSVALPLSGSGRAAVDLLLSLVDASNRRRGTSQVLPVQLVVRSSTGPRRSQQYRAEDPVQDGALDRAQHRPGGR